MKYEDLTAVCAERRATVQRSRKEEQSYKTKCVRSGMWNSVRHDMRVQVNQNAKQQCKGAGSHKHQRTAESESKLAAKLSTRLPMVTSDDDDRVGQNPPDKRRQYACWLG